MTLVSMDVTYRNPTVDDIPDLATSTTKCFSDYFLPIKLDERMLRDFIKINDIDLSLSIVVIDDNGRIKGQSLTGRRDDTAWLAGTGLVPKLRGQKIGMRMLGRQLKGLREAGVTDIRLEVLVQNERAKKVYEGLGFKRRRDLYSFRMVEPFQGDLDPPEHLRFETCDAKDVLDLYRPDNPWQSMKESVAKMDDLKAFLSFQTVQGGPTQAEGLRGAPTDPLADLHEATDLPHLPDVDDPEELMNVHGPELEGYCVYTTDNKSVKVIDIYSVGNARYLLRHLLWVTGRKPTTTINIFDSMSVMAYETMGFERWYTQHEMSLSQ
jgi:ribosomal protein S18 acetylase RimI-like enzyme